MINLDFPKENRKLLYCFYLLGRQNTPSRWAAKNLEDYTVDRESKLFLSSSKKHGSYVTIPKVNICVPKNKYLPAIIRDSRSNHGEIELPLIRKLQDILDEGEVLPDKEIKIRYHPEGRVELHDLA